MLYLDSSALIKHYVQEAGSGGIKARIEAEQGATQVFTSVLTYAEVQRVLARKKRDKELRAREFTRARKKFDADWLFGLTSIELKSDVLVYIKSLVERFALKASDIVQLASALWVRDSARLGAISASAELVVATSDKQLARAAKECELEVYNPELIS
jgi:predicted nucleic acid-binding protein